MPNKLSSRKRVRQNERRRLRNRGVRSSMRSAVKDVTTLIKHEDTENIDSALKTAQSRLGKAAKRNIIKKNKLARAQSRLMKAAQKAKAAASSE